jgi:hypothetical protein
MNDESQEAFEKWLKDEFDEKCHIPLLEFTWQAACAYKQKEIDELEREKDYLCKKMENMRAIYKDSEKLQAENAKLKAIVMLASEACCYTEYEDACSLARQTLKELDENK